MVAIAWLSSQAHDQPRSQTVPTEHRCPSCEG